jgi:GNAT superfamily N-acetyltransferase
MTRDEFLGFHNTGWIPYEAYDKYRTVEGLSWLGKKEEYPILHSKGVFGGREIEFRQSGEKLDYVKHTEDGEDIARDERGYALMLTEDEIAARGLQRFDTTIVAFDGVTPVGLVSDEFGTSGVWVAEPYQKMGIGLYLLREFSRTFPGRKLGQMTGPGQALSMALHRRFVEEAVREGKPVPEEVLKEYPNLDRSAESISKSASAEREYPVSAVIVAAGRVFEGRTHGEALQQAEDHGYVTRDDNGEIIDRDGKNLSYDGSIDMFRTNRGRLIDRYEAYSLGGAVASEDIPEKEADTLDKVLERHRGAGVDVAVYDDGKTLLLGTLRVPKGERKHGLGTAFMEDLCAYADRVGKRIGLNLGDKERGETTSKGRLIEFYKRFGFVRNFGRTKDYTFSNQMYRDPKGRKK